jgi:hypothetical protein
MLNRHVTTHQSGEILSPLIAPPKILGTRTSPTRFIVITVSECQRSGSLVDNRVLKRDFGNHVEVADCWMDQQGLGVV